MTATRLQSRIEAVTVYREGARIRRVCEIEATGQGYPPEVCLTGLPLVLQDASVRVSIELAGGAAGALPVAADVCVTLDVPEADDSLRPPVDAELEAARADLRRVAGRIAQARRELSRLDRLVVAQRPRAGDDAATPPPPSPTEARMALLVMREDRERALRGEIAALEREHQAAEREARKLEARHQRASSARQARENELRKALVIALRGPSAAPRVRLVAEYMVPGARWAPAYTVRLLPGQPAQFSMRAVVAQRTDEDWRGARLTLSTADAHAWTELPELGSLRIGRQQRQPQKTGWRPPPLGADELFGDYDRELGGAARQKSAVPRPAQQWDDETREIAMSTRRAGSVPEGAVAPGDFDEVTSPYAAPPMEEPTMPFGAAPAQLARPSAPPPPSMRPPPAPAAAMPVSMDFARAPAKKRSGGLFRSQPEAAKELRSEAPPAPGRFSYDDLADGIGGGGGLEPQSPQALTASTELLAYADLRMPAPGSDQRGALQPAQRMDLYLEYLVSQRIEVSFNVLAVIAVAARRAQAVAHAPLPARHRAAQSDRYDYAYISDTVVDVPSDGAFHGIALMSKRADVTMRHVVVPRESTDVFRVAEVANPLRAPILDGPVDVYLDRDFLLTSDVAFTPPGGTMRLGLGVEQAIKVSRNTAYREEASGLMRGSVLCKHELRIEVINHLERAIDCEVRERVPAVREGEADIEVSVERTSPAWKRYQPALASSPEAALEGGHHWQIHLDPGQRTTLEADYVVKIPAKYELAGGNRREA